MPIEKHILLEQEAPFQVTLDAKPRRKPLTVKAFAQNDPLGVGGGLLPDIPVVYFQGGGWITADDLMPLYSLVE